MVQQNKAGWFKWISVILAVLLGFSFFTFVLYCILCIHSTHLSYKAVPSNLQTVPMMATSHSHHIIGPEAVLDVKATTESNNDTDIELYKDHPNENRQFQITDLRPGETITKNIHIKIYHNQKINLYYKTEITAQTDAIADHLTIRVVSMEDNSVLYEGKLSAFCGQELAISVNKNEQNVTIQDFRIELVIDDSVNSIENSSEIGLAANWYVKEDVPSNEDSGIINPPATGDLPPMSITIILAGTLLSLGVVAMICKEKKDKE